MPVQFRVLGTLASTNVRRRMRLRTPGVQHVTAFALVCALGAAPEAAADSFKAKDRPVSDGGVSITNPSFDQITNTMVWQDGVSNVWLAQVDPITGDINPPNGMGKLLDTKAADPSITGNTAMFSSGDGFSSIIYSRWVLNTLALGEITQDSRQVWSMQDVIEPLYRWKPEGTHANWSGPAKQAYNYLDGFNQVIGWRNVGDAASERTAYGALPNAGARWIEGENLLLASIMDRGIKQAATINTDAPNPFPIQVTFEAEDTFNAYSWWAPEFNAPVFSAMIGNQKLGIFRKTGKNQWENYYTFTIPSDHKYFSSPEGFVWNGKSYVFFVAMKEPGDGRFPFQPTKPSQIWIAGIDRDNPFFRRIDDPRRVMIKAEPEVFFTAEGPQIYYGELNFQRNWVQRLADTGLGTEWGYDNQFYSGPWASPFRDNKNCSCTPFPVGDGYLEEAAFPSMRNRQWMRQVMGPEGNLYVPFIYAQKDLKAGVGAFDTASAREIFRLNANEVDPGLLGSNALVAPNGDVILSTNIQLARHTNSGAQVWSVPIRGMAENLQFGPAGNLLAFTFNGWFQSFSADNGRLLNEKILTPWRSYPANPTCLSGSAPWNCAYLAAPAVDMRASRVYVSYTSETATGSVQAYAYDGKSHGLTKLWESAALANGSIGSPVLSADYSRLYVQSKDGKLFAIDAATGAVIWKFDLMISALGTPVVTEFGYIVPGARQSDSSTMNYVGIIKDTGASAQWAFKTTDFAAQSLAAAGRGNRFVMMASRYSDNALVLLVVHPKFGVISQTPVTVGPPPAQLTGIIIDQSGWIYVGTSGTSPYRTFRPKYTTMIQ